MALKTIAYNQHDTTSTFLWVENYVSCWCSFFTRVSNPSQLVCWTNWFWPDPVTRSFQPTRASAAPRSSYFYLGWKSWCGNLRLFFTSFKNKMNRKLLPDSPPARISHFEVTTLSDKALDHIWIRTRDLQSRFAQT